jgi:hypothetical protein
MLPWMLDGGAYRDRTSGLSARVAALREDVAARLLRLPPAVWPRLPAVTALTLAAAHAELPAAHPATVDEATLQAIALERMRDALDRAIAEAAALEPHLLSLPDVAPPLQPMHRFDAVARALHEVSRALERVGINGWAALADETVGAFGAIVLRRFPDAHVERVAPHASRATLRTHGTPIALLCEVPPPVHAPFGGAVELRAATGVPLALPRLVLRPEVVAGLDVEIGDPDFDGLFDVVAPLADARAVLVPEVRAALVRLAWHDVPRVRVGDGHAEIAWTYEPTRDAIDEAARALVALRRVEVAARLLAW